MTPLSRREFLSAGVAAGAGLVIGFYLPHRGASGSEFSPNAFIRITPDGKITLVVARSEMGQGVRTALPMILAEELEADWTRITVEQAGSDPALYGDQQTGSSTSVKISWDPLRKAGAAAREMLMTAAAQEWGVPRSGCRAENSAVVHDESHRRLSYGQLAARAARLPIPVAPPLKDAKDYKLVGKRMPRLDTLSKCDGTAVFGLDFRVPEMKFALLARCPVMGGTVRSFDDTEAKKTAGVSYVGKVGGDAVAVVADSVWGAMEGRRLLNIEWDEGPNASLDSAAVYELLHQSVEGKAAVLYSTGDVAKANGRKIEAVYTTPLMAHAALEPGNCTAHFRGTTCDIWGPMQWPPDVRDAVAKAVGLDAGAVQIHVTLLGGGFGRRLDHDYAVEAALVSKAIGAPVKVVWTREDDMRHSGYRPASYHRLRATLDAEGWPVAFHHRIVEPSVNTQKGIPPTVEGVDVDLPDEASLIYSFPNALRDYVMTVTPVTPAYMRSVYGLETAFAAESFLDELAAAAGKDPLQYRLHLLQKDEDIKFFDTPWKTARMRGALQLAADKAGWGKPLPAGRYRGLACFGCFGTYMAEVVEISMANGQPVVHRVVGAMDCGQVINPNILEQQIQGGVIFALANALRCQITLAKGRVVQGNFDDYPPVRMMEAPTVEAYFVPSTEAPTGAGEPPVPPLAPALCNAIYAATKKRIRTLPVIG